jgi:hypothetical protein
MLDYPDLEGTVDVVLCVTGCEGLSGSSFLASLGSRALISQYTLIDVYILSLVTLLIVY